MTTIRLTSSAFRHVQLRRSIAFYDFLLKVCRLVFGCVDEPQGGCWDNAAMESVNATLKVECVDDMHFEARGQAKRMIVE